MCDLKYNDYIIEVLRLDISERKRDRQTDRQKEGEIERKRDREI